MHPFLWLMITISVISVVYLTTLLTVLTSRREDWLIKKMNNNWPNEVRSKFQLEDFAKNSSSVCNAKSLEPLVRYWCNFVEGSNIRWKCAEYFGTIRTWPGQKKRIFKLFGKTCLSLFIIIYWKRAFKFETLINYEH